VKNWILKYFNILKQTVKEFIRDNPMNYSSSIAFYLIFSLPAISIITLFIAGAAYKDQVVQQNMMQQIQLLFGAQSAETMNLIFANVNATGTTLVAKVFGVGMIIFSATTVFISLQNGLNSVWGIKSKPKRDVLKFFINRLLSFAMVISIGFLLLVSLVLNTFISVFNNLLTDWFSGITSYIIPGTNLILSLVIITVVFAMIYKILPDARVRWADVWVGAFVTTLLFLLGKYLIGFYLGTSSLSTTYGAAGSLVLLLIWVYYSSIIIFVGAEFTYVYSKEVGHQIRPDKNAVIVDVVEREDGVVNN
jgi:membrane protein